MTEEYLHYIWKYGLFVNSSDNIKIIESGEHNHDAGPDFFNAKIKINNTLWVGNVEIHIKSSDWFKHQHQKDKAYDNVILHVVYEHDKEVCDSTNRVLPVLELKDKVSYTDFKDYKKFVKPSLPCSNHLQNVSPLVILNTKERVLIERLDQKCTRFKQSFLSTKKDWEETFYHHLFRSLGSGLNGDMFMLLAKNIPLKYLRKHDDLLQLEALLFGVANLIPENSSDHYTSTLIREFRFFQTKYQLNKLNKVSWKFSKIRPSNFPTVRIAQLARLIHSKQNLFDTCIKRKPKVEDLIAIFNVELSEGYWYHHYVFDKESKAKKKSLGKKSIQNIGINLIAPMSFFYGEYMGDLSYKDYALELLEQLPFETNRYTNKFVGKMEQKTAFDSQAMIGLYKDYCTPKRCLSCAIGQHILEK